MERTSQAGAAAERGDDDDDSDEESPGGSAPRNTPARQMDPARAARLAADLRDASSGGASPAEAMVLEPRTATRPRARLGFSLREPVRERRARDGRRACRRRWRGPAPAGGLDPRVALGSGTRAREGEARAGGGREKARLLEATNAALERRLAGKRELQAEGAAETRDASENVSRGAVGGSDASDEDDSDDSDAWSDDDVGTTPRRRRGFFSSLNPFARR